MSLPRAGEVAQIESPRPNPLPASRGEGNVFQTVIVPSEEVRARFKRVKPLKEISITQRGWTLDVLNIVRRISEVGTAGSAVRAPSGRKLPAALPPVTSQRDVPTNTFTTAEAYAFTRELEKLHPDNKHIKDKIRQQLQVLRDMGLLMHVGRGVWRLPETGRFLILAHGAFPPKPASSSSPPFYPMTGALADAFKSGAQRARVVTEAWGEKHLFCPNCDKSRAGCLSPKTDLAGAGTSGQ